MKIIIFIRHIKEDLEAHQLPTDKNVDELTEEEKNYLYFKVHDLDGNDKLDGLEIYYSATHHSVSQSPPERQESQESINHDNNEAHQVSQLNESESQHSSHLEILERDENGQLVDTNFNHIIGTYQNHRTKVVHFLKYLVCIHFLFRRFRQFFKPGRFKQRWLSELCRICGRR